MIEPKEESINQDAMSFLEQQDKTFGKNNGEPISEPTPKQTSLGQAKQTEHQNSTISGANDPYWKNLPIENLPSQGLFYPEGTEITTRAASTGEIRHWSTIDEGDMLAVDDMLNFIIEKCVRIKSSVENSWLSWRDIVEIDRMYILFAIHEQTFPNKENVLWTKFTCTNQSCGDGKPYSTEVRASKDLMQSLELPEEIMQYYKAEYRCFEVVSQKMNETFYLYAPTLGAVERIKNKIVADRKAGKQIDKAFVKIAPYLIQDWSSFNDAEFLKQRQASISWHQNKFPFVNRFADLYNGSKSDSLYLGCSVCSSKMKSPLFLGASFTIKSLFLISGRLDELV